MARNMRIGDCSIIIAERLEVGEVILTAIQKVFVDYYSEYFQCIVNSINEEKSVPNILLT